MAIRLCEVCTKKYSVGLYEIKRGSRFCSSKCYGKYRSKIFVKSKHPAWRGGITYNEGYRYIFKPKHPQASKKGYIMEHRWVMEQTIGRLLDVSNEIVHHRNGNKLDNRIDNLELMTRAQHLLHHLHPNILHNPT